MLLFLQIAKICGETAPNAPCNGTFNESCRWMHRNSIPLSAGLKKEEGKAG
jgi:hypothetical protein